MAESTKTKSIFIPYQVARLQTIAKFLIHICDTDIVVAVLKVGFDSDEHALGTNDYRIAAGLNVGLAQHISSAVYDRVQSGGAVTQAKVRRVDQFENRWFPRVRNALRRFLEPARRDEFLEAFFRDMQQQPEGPLAVDSVRKLIPRMEELATSTVPGAKEAYASLLKKGLQAELDEVKQLLAQLETHPAVATPTAPVSVADIQKLAQERLAAYERLNLWYTDWAEVFRAELTYHQLARLGLVAVGGSPSEPKPEEPPTQPVP
jgi:hypothetical protein